MITADIHTHSTFSEDGRSDIRDMVEAAISAGLQTYGISEHLNYEYERLHLKIDGEEPRSHRRKGVLLRHTQTAKRI